MRREKEIEQFAQTQVDCEFFDESLYNGIIIGATWADKNPKRYTQEELCDIQLEMMKQCDNRYVTDTWLRNNDYLVEDVSTFAGAGKRYTNKIKNINVEIVLVNDIEGYHLTLKNHSKRMEYSDNLCHLTIDKFNTLLSIFD